jgi:DNA-binding MarR family transcriptional regulator
MEQLETDLDQLEQAMRLLFQTIKRPQQWAKITDIAGISIDRPSASILHILMVPRPQGWRIHDIAVQLGIEAPSITRKSQELESAGLVRRVPNPLDRRAIGLQLTAAGKTINNKLKRAQRVTMSEALLSWTDSDRRLFIELFSRFAHDLSARPTPIHEK